MASFNKVLLIGNLTKDPELRYTPQGTAVANLRLAVNRRFKTQSGEQKDEVCYITCVVWDKQAETCNQYLRKGQPILVEGRLQSRSWEDNAGQKRNVVEVRAERVQFLGAPQQQKSSGAGVEEIQVEQKPSEETYSSNSWLEEGEEKANDNIKE
ncbi:MAG: single-stranded DNA-binding protein [Candidatus Omnitrophica bacterium]|nr:single-stranded DNA-binding protein [Candidatus Omnitrophota bacterium]MDD5610097.1 single-stranded DNA-binding protein [Candidatus Omnitrophota bacterium]